MEIHRSVLERQKSEAESQRTKMSTNREKSIAEEERKSEGERCDRELCVTGKKEIRFVRRRFLPTQVGKKKGFDDNIHLTHKSIKAISILIMLIIRINASIHH